MAIPYIPETDTTDNSAYWDAWLKPYRDGLAAAQQRAQAAQQAQPQAAAQAPVASSPLLDRFFGAPGSGREQSKRDFWQGFGAPDYHGERNAAYRQEMLNNPTSGAVDTWARHAGDAFAAIPNTAIAGINSAANDMRAWEDGYKARAAQLHGGAPAAPADNAGGGAPDNYHLIPAIPSVTTAEDAPIDAQHKLAALAGDWTPAMLMGAEGAGGMIARGLPSFWRLAALAGGGGAAGAAMTPLANEAGREAQGDYSHATLNPFAADWSGTGKNALIGMALGAFGGKRTPDTVLDPMETTTAAAPQNLVQTARQMNMDLSKQKAAGTAQTPAAQPQAAAAGDAAAPAQTAQGAPQAGGAPAAGTQAAEGAAGAPRYPWEEFIGPEAAERVSQYAADRWGGKPQQQGQAAANDAGLPGDGGVGAPAANEATLRAKTIAEWANSDDPILRRFGQEAQSQMQAQQPHPQTQAPAQPQTPAQIRQSLRDKLDAYYAAEKASRGQETPELAAARADLQNAQDKANAARAADTTGYDFGSAFQVDATDIGRELMRKVRGKFDQSEAALKDAIAKSGGRETPELAAARQKYSEAANSLWSNEVVARDTKGWSGLSEAEDKSWGDVAQAEEALKVAKKAANGQQTPETAAAQQRLTAAVNDALRVRRAAQAAPEPAAATGGGAGGGNGGAGGAGSPPPRAQQKAQALPDNEKFEQAFQAGDVGGAFGQQEERFAARQHAQEGEANAAFHAARADILHDTGDQALFSDAERLALQDLGVDKEIGQQDLTNIGAKKINEQGAKWTNILRKRQKAAETEYKQAQAGVKAADSYAAMQMKRHFSGGANIVEEAIAERKQQLQDAVAQGWRTQAEADAQLRAYAASLRGSDYLTGGKWSEEAAQNGGRTERQIAAEQRLAQAKKAVNAARALNPDALAPKMQEWANRAFSGKDKFQRDQFNVAQQYGDASGAVRGGGGEAAGNEGVWPHTNAARPTDKDLGEADAKYQRGAWKIQSDFAKWGQDNEGVRPDAQHTFDYLAQKAGMSDERTGSGKQRTPLQQAMQGKAIQRAYADLLKGEEQRPHQAYQGLSDIDRQDLADVLNGKPARSGSPLADAVNKAVAEAQGGGGGAGETLRALGDVAQGAGFIPGVGPALAAGGTAMKGLGALKAKWAAGRAAKPLSLAETMRAAEQGAKAAGKEFDAKQALIKGKGGGLRAAIARAGLGTAAGTAAGAGLGAGQSAAGGQGQQQTVWQSPDRPLGADPGRQPVRPSKWAQMIGDALGAAGSGLAAYSALRNGGTSQPYAGQTAEQLSKQWGIPYGAAAALATDPKALGDTYKQMLMNSGTLSEHQQAAILKVRQDKQQLSQAAEALSDIKRLSDAVGDTYAGPGGWARFEAESHMPTSMRSDKYADQVRLEQQLNMMPQVMEQIYGIGASPTDASRAMRAAQHAKANDTQAVRDSWLNETDKMLTRKQQFLDSQEKQIAAMPGSGWRGGLAGLTALYNASALARQ